ncbi:MAG: glycine zipper 2TM domain-containing protein [Gammaproteobacteria bacterium]|nr:glycine zipper 2TM domain-containing protein [Gammaproteobacteria bacterium]
MDKSMITGLAIGAVVATAGGVIAGYTALSGKQASEPEAPAFAEVLDVETIKRTVQTPREVCEDVPVTKQKPTQDPNKVTGTVAGAILGGVLGNQVGEGTGKKLATVAGAVAGGVAGNKVQENMQANNTYTTTERQCRTVNDTSQVVDGYNVTYRLGETEGQVRMDHDPGDRIPVENGQLVLNAR